MFNKEFYEKTYLQKFDSYESAYNHWKCNPGRLGEPIYDEKKDFYYHSQIGQDYFIINKIFNRKESGVFLEFGACDGLFLSNTYVLEKYFNWSGLCIEPHEEYYKNLLINRKCYKDNSLLDSHTGLEVEYSSQQYPEVSGIRKYKNGHWYDNEKIIKLTTTSLNDVLAKYDNIKTIDYLSIDTEGNELNIMSTFDFEKYKINYISIEYGGKKKEIYDFLTNKNFSLYRDNLWDSEYINNDFKK